MAHFWDFFLFSYVGNSRLFIVTFCSTFVATGLLSTLLHLNKPTETRRFSDKKINCSIRDPRLKRICYVAGTTTHPVGVISKQSKAASLYSEVIEQCYLLASSLDGGEEIYLKDVTWSWSSQKQHTLYVAPYTLYVILWIAPFPVFIFSRKSHTFCLTFLIFNTY